ncbi:hypothetical protein J6590_061676 [Homalodisca vitripennis]|nr:hypothetical protein J6590_061676 [Homalodisca vitripennis]
MDNLDSNEEIAHPSFNVNKGNGTHKSKRFKHMIGNASVLPEQQQRPSLVCILVALHQRRDGVSSNTDGWMTRRLAAQWDKSFTAERSVSRPLWSLRSCRSARTPC